MRILLGVMALLLWTWASGDASRAMLQSAGVGSAGLLTLAIVPSRLGTRWLHYALALLMISPWIWPWIWPARTGSVELGLWDGVLAPVLAALGIAVWASFGLRYAKGPPSRAGLAPQLLAMLALLGIWLAIGFMGAAMSTLIWSQPDLGSAPNTLLGWVLTLFCHGQHLLETPQPDETLV